MRPTIVPARNVIPKPYQRPHPPILVGGNGPRVLERRTRVLDELAQVVDRGRLVTSASREPPEVVAEGVVGAVFAVLYTRAGSFTQDSTGNFVNASGLLAGVIAVRFANSLSS